MRCVAKQFVVYCLLLLASTANAGDSRKPNIIVILADDLGAETIASYGGESYATPQLDALARDGVRFEYGHAQPLCTPSRVKIMTGRYNAHNYKYFGYLDPDETTFAHMLKAAGYRTAVAGKWQLYSNRFQDLQGATPQSAGFDEHALWQIRPEVRGSRFWAPLVTQNGEVTQYPESTFGPDVFNAFVLAFMQKHASEPFFIYYPMLLTHSPWVTTPDMVDEGASDAEKFSAMVAYMDKLVGRVKQQALDLGLAQNTVIVFVGDNGTDTDITSRFKGAEVQGAKGKSITAGSHVPFIVWGPGYAKSGQVSRSLVHIGDIFPTLAELARQPVDPQLDGVSLLSVLRGEGELQRDSIFMHYEPMWGPRTPARYAFDRRWKLYERGDFFDMQTDPLEQSPLTVDELTGEARGAYHRLKTRLDAAPGQLNSSSSLQREIVHTPQSVVAQNRQWIALAVLLLLLLLLLRIRRKRS